MALQFLSHAPSGDQPAPEENFEQLRSVMRRRIRPAGTFSLYLGITFFALVAVLCSSRFPNVIFLLTLGASLSLLVASVVSYQRSWAGRRYQVIYFSHFFFGSFSSRDWQRLDGRSSCCRAAVGLLRNVPIIQLSLSVLSV